MVELIGYSNPLSVIYSEHVRIISHICQSQGRLTYSQFCVLLALAESDQGLKVKDIHDITALEIPSLWSMLYALEDRQLVRKTSDEADGRHMVLHITEKGRSCASDCFEAASLALKDRFWRYLPTDEYHRAIISTFERCLAVIREAEAPSNCVATRTNEEFRLSSFLFWKDMLDIWEKTVRERADLTLNEFRLLDVIVSDGPMTASQCAQRIHISKSVVSNAKRTLLDRRYISETTKKEVSTIQLAPTKRGKALAEKTRAALDALTKPCHATETPEAADIIQAWHSRMYSNCISYSSN